MTVATKPFWSQLSNWLGPLAMICTLGVVLNAAIPLVQDGALLNIPGLMIVVLGTITATLSTMIGSDLRAFWSGTRNLMLSSSPEIVKDVKSMVEIAHRCRQSDIQSMERLIGRWKQFDTLHHGLAMHLDGKQPTLINDSIMQHIHTNDHWWKITIAAVRRAAETAPAMGLLGTIIGLLGMLGKLDTPSEIGPAMALALLTTLYGALLAYGVLAPLADRLDRQREVHLQRMKIEAETVNSIVRNENVRHLQTAIMSLLTPNDRSMVNQ